VKLTGKVAGRHRPVILNRGSFSSVRLTTAASRRTIGLTTYQHDQIPKVRGYEPRRESLVTRGRIGFLTEVSSNLAAGRHSSPVKSTGFGSQDLLQPHGWRDLERVDNILILTDQNEKGKLPDQTRV
jgi:hypothetical protein